MTTIDTHTEGEQLDAGLPLGDELAMRLADLAAPDAAIDLAVRPAPAGAPTVVAVPTGGGRLTIGRGGADIDVDLPLVSRSHAELWCADGLLFVADSGSRNGTWVRREGERIAATEPVEIFQGDEIITISDTPMLTIGGAE